MAPEQVLADPIDARTDIYAFGVVLFGMLTGVLPFDVNLGPDLFCHQLFSPAPPPSSTAGNRSAPHRIAPVQVPALRAGTARRPY